MMENMPAIAIDIYFSYWKEHIQSIEEEKRRAEFDDILIDVGHRLYGLDFALELAFLFLKAQNADIGAEHVSG